MTDQCLRTRRVHSNQTSSLSIGDPKQFTRVGLNRIRWHRLKTAGRRAVEGRNAHGMRERQLQRKSGREIGNLLPWQAQAFQHLFATVVASHHAPGRLHISAQENQRAGGELAHLHRVLGKIEVTFNFVLHRGGVLVRQRIPENSIPILQRRVGGEHRHAFAGELVREGMVHLRNRVGLARHGRARKLHGIRVERIIHHRRVADAKAGFFAGLRIGKVIRMLPVDVTVHHIELRH